jgi:2-methylfumaryl-CoA isomerase
MTMTGLQPLRGMRVVEVSAFVAAPLGGMSLALMGADVIRIDPPQGGLDYRRWPLKGEGASLFWAGLNQGKRSVAIDIGQPEGRELAQALITAPGDDAGLLITNFPARGWLAHEALRALRADLIQITLQGDRHGGSAVDYTINPRLGLPWITGAKGDPRPVNHVLPAWDLLAGQTLATGLLVAERHRRATGEGAHVKLALEDVALAAMSHLGFIAEAQFGQARERHGNDLFGAFGRDFMTADSQRVMIVGLTLKQWQALCNATETRNAMGALGRRLGVDLDLEGERFQAREAIAELVAPWIGARKFAEVAAAFDQHGVCWGRYQTVKQLVDGGSVSPDQNPLFSCIHQHGVGDVLSAGLPLDFDGTPLPARASPSLGEHTEQVLSQVLGLTAGAIGALQDRGLILAGATAPSLSAGTSGS